MTNEIKIILSTVDKTRDAFKSEDGHLQGISSRLTIFSDRLAEAGREVANECP